MKKRIAWFFHVTHPYRATFWAVMVPICVLLGWHTSLFVIFLYSTYSNIASDVAAWEAAE